jgi:mycoredoxin-dependent peroxiredoxin
MAIAVGQPAPEFTLKDQDQKDIKLSDYRGKNVVLMFYPLDWSPVCTDEHACFMSRLGDFEKLNAQVLGLSVDSHWSHKAFAEKMGVRYPLLADFHPRGAVADKFGMYHADKGITGRAIVIIDRAGNIAWLKNYGFGEAPNTKEVAEALARVR